MNYTQVLGGTNELRCLIAFMELGYDCSIPYGNGSNYDFIVDDGEKLLKIQCKSSHYVRDKKGNELTDCFCFSAERSNINTKGSTKIKYSSKDIDYFATSFNGKVYVIPVDECSSGKTLRLKPPKINLKNYNNAEDYEITKVFSELGHFVKSKEDFINRNNESYQNSSKNYVCRICGKPISSKDGLCLECSSKERRKIANRPSRDELKDLIRTKSFLKIGEQFGVSDQSIRKWCKGYKLPFRKSEIENYSNEDWKKI